MITLGVDTSAVFVSIAIVRDGILLGETFTRSGQGHSTLLLPMIDALLRDCGLAVADVDRFAVTRGPGSFTGVRIGAATVKGLGAARGRLCAGVSTLAAMAAGAPEGHPGILCCAMDARRAQVYAAIFEGHARLCEDEALPLAELEQRLLTYNQPVTFLGDGAQLCYDTMQKRPDWRPAPESWRYQRGYGAVLAAREEDYLPAEELRVNYLRPSQAERELMQAPPVAARHPPQ